MMIPFFGLLEADTRLMVERARRKCLILFSIFCLGTACILTLLSFLLIKRYSVHTKIDFPERWQTKKNDKERLTKTDLSKVYILRNRDQHRINRSNNMCMVKVYKQKRLQYWPECFTVAISFKLKLLVNHLVSTFQNIRMCFSCSAKPIQYKNTWSINFG